MRGGLVDSIVKRLFENRKLRESSADYICKSIKVDSKGVMEILCYDQEYDEEFDKYIGQVDDLSARKAARLILEDPKFEVPKEIRNELISTFGLEDYGFQIEESVGEDITYDQVEEELYEIESELEEIEFDMITASDDYAEELLGKVADLEDRMSELASKSEASELISDRDWRYIEKILRKMDDRVYRITNMERGR